MTPGTIVCADLTAGTDQLLWTADEPAIIAVLLTNRTSGEILVRIAIVKTGETLGLQHWIEYDAALPGNQPLERTNRVVGTGDKVYGRCSATGVSARIDGIQAT